ncbi:MAG: MFS transporter [Clostridiales bacterium]|uniref:Na+/melibiose symporter-like transporter n=1 Tax=Harryflintia acetispora TaxID=1849041 RepID=A0A9X8UJL5_9FIRM|nr:MULTISPECIES: MFS transporter [Oscillospiraceae]PWM38659.1 MAG: MFS transporter [Clostridiales bacterium]RGB68287.1 MFS transporter [Harryflintia acetispora]TCL43777.1 Na+/melibiose symporter-like transporter [Harryflintia acetispora]
MSYFKKENLLFYAFNVVYFACSSLYFGFIVMYLTAHGYSSFECGVINTIISLVEFLFQPVAGYITDTFMSIKKYIILCSAGAILTTYLLPLTVHNMLGASISVMLLTLFAYPLTYLADTWSVTLRESLSYIDYGKNRSGGSVGYSVTSALAGVLIAKFGYDLLFLLHVILFAVVIVIVLFIPGVPCGNARKKKVEGAQLQPEQGESLSFGGIIKMLLRNQKYMVFLLSTFCFYMALKAWCTYIPYKIIELGGADKELGYAIALAAVGEIPILFIMNRCVQRFRLSFIYITATLCLFARGLLMLTAQSMSMVMLSELLEAFTYAFFIAVSLEMINRIVPRSIRTTAVTVEVAVTNGLSGIIGTFIGGILVDRFGVDMMSLVMCVMSALGVLLFAVPTYIQFQRDRELVV